MLTLKSTDGELLDTSTTNAANVLCNSSMNACFIIMLETGALHCDRDSAIHCVHLIEDCAH